MYRIVLLCAMASMAFAGGPEVPGQDGNPTDQGAGGGGDMFGLLMFLPLIGIFVFMMWSQGRSQKKEKQKREEMLDGLKVGDEIVTIGGMIGKIVRKGDTDVDVKLGLGDQTIVQRFTLQAVANPRLEAEEEAAKA